jgi:hypothetical protein
MLLMEARLHLIRGRSKGLLKFGDANALLSVECRCLICQFRIDNGFSACDYLSIFLEPLAGARE